MNTLLLLIPELLRTLATAPASASYLTPFIDDILSTAATLIERGEAGSDALVQFTGAIKAMVLVNRAPTDDEWAALKARSDAASTDIQSAAHRTP